MKKKQKGGDEPELVLDPTTFLQALKKEGVGVQTAAEAAQVNGWLSTGNYALNWAISGQFSLGYPGGHVVEVFGDNSTGKSFLMALAMAEAQATGGIAVLDDTEGAFSADRTRSTIGVNTDTLIYRRSRTVSEHSQLVCAVAKSLKTAGPSKRRVSALVLDSLALLSTDHELAEPGKRDMTRAQEIRRLFRVNGTEISDLPLAYLVTNHKTAEIGGMAFGPQTTTPGGSGLKFQASVRIDLRTPAKIKAPNGEYVGVIITAFIAKNRLTTPWRSIKIAIPFHMRIEPTSGLVKVLLDLGLIQHHGQNLVVWGEDSGIKAHVSAQGFLKQDQSAKQLLEKYPGFIEWADEQLRSRGVEPAPEIEGAEGEEDE
jgi:recombination protein RecA